MSLKLSSLLGLAIASSLAATSAVAGSTDLSEALLATKIKQAQTRTTVAAQIEKAKAWGVSPVMAAKLERIHKKQAENRRHLMAILARSEQLNVSPVMAAYLEKIQAKQRETRRQLAKQIDPEALSTVHHSDEFDG